MLAYWVLGIVAVVVVVALVVYNRLVRGRNQVAEAWSGIEVQLRRRASLIPNLVETVGGYAQHERATFEEVTRARSALQAAGGVHDTAQASDQLTRALGRLLAVAEQYPQLRASENFQRLQGDLSDTEDKVAFARQFYNRTVLAYNNQVATFPSAAIATAFRFKAAEFFEADEAAHEEVRVHFRAPTAPGSSPAD